MDGHHLYGDAEPGVAPAELAAVAEELAKTSSKVLATGCLVGTVRVFLVCSLLAPVCCSA